jgi:hypothetical protein
MKRYLILSAVLLLIVGCMEGSESPAPDQEDSLGSEEIVAASKSAMAGSPKEAWELLRQRLLEKDWEAVWSLYSKNMQDSLCEDMTEIKEVYKDKDDLSKSESATGLTYAELVEMEPKEIYIQFLKAKLLYEDPSSWTFVDETTEGKLSTIRYESGEGRTSLVFVETKVGWLLTLSRGPHPGGQIGANEANAIGSLKCICTGQEQFKSANCIDLNTNGVGEYGFLDELGGTAACRVDNVGTQTGKKFSASPYIPRSLGTLDSNGIATKSGYCFILYLPSTLHTGTARGLEPLDIPIAETAYVAFAWPIEQGTSGVRLFAIDPQGQPYCLAESPHSGPNDPPPWDLAFHEGSNWKSYIDDAGPGQTGQGLKWVPVG